MRQRRRVFRGLGVLCLTLGLAAAVAGVVFADPEFPYNPANYLTRKGIGDAPETTQYYNEISAPLTFAAWYAQYFPGTAATYADARYYNAGDLGFGRGMHCREEPDFTACYVVNHGLGAAAPAELSVQDAVAGTRVLPTVAMVYDFTRNNLANDVTFYAYDPAGNRLRAVALDSGGEKYIPQLCLACHGGDYDDINNEVAQANFLPWDIDSFRFSPAAGFTRADQLEQFRVLNAYVYNSFPDAKITSLIEGWYGGVNAVYSPSAVYDDSYIPAAYDTNNTDRQLYTEVVKPYCRGCHMAQGFDLEDPSQLNSAFNAVFVERAMPHAQLTAHRFWSSPAPAILARKFAATYVVNTTADAPDDGCTTTPGGCTLREAVIAANSNPNHSIIVFGVNGTFSLTNGGTDDSATTGDLDLLTDITILGNGAALTIIDGAGVDRVFQIKSGANVLIQNVTIQNGSSPVGAGLRVNDGSSMLTLNFSVVKNNHGTTSGDTGSGLAVEDASSAEINQSAFTGNTGPGKGGAILNDGSTVAIYNSTLSGNGASDGGGVYSRIGSTTTLDHVTVAFNNATSTGGGLATNNVSTINLINSIVAGNTSPGATDCQRDHGSVEYYYGRNLVGQNGGNGGCPTDPANTVLAGSINTVLQSLSTDPANGVTMHLPTGTSVVLDAIPLGADCTTPSYDAHNVARPRDANNNGSLGCDIGAVEAATTAVYLPFVRR